MKEFISKLNDRNLQRKRESGLTSYVIYSIFILILYKLFTNTEFLLITTEYEPKNLKNFLWLFCFTFNALFNLGYTINYLFPNISVFENIRLLKKSKTDYYVYLSFLLSFPLGLFLICYTYFTIPIKSTLFHIYSLYILLTNLAGIYNAGKLYFNSKKNELIVSQNKKQNSIIPNIIDILLSFLIIAISSYYIYIQDISYKAEFIKILILLYLGYAVVEKIIQVNIKDQYYTKLEDFEYEIKLKNLGNEEISREFQDQFLGFLLMIGYRCR